MKKILPIINAISGVLLFLILLFTKTSANFVYIIIMSLFVGWAIPFLSLIISGITIKIEKHLKLTLIFDILAFCLTLFLLFLIFKIYDKNFLILVIEYFYIIVLNIINIIYIIIYIKKHPDLELKKIKDTLSLYENDIKLLT